MAPGPDPSAPVSANRQIARAAGTVMLAFVASNLVGLLAKMLTARAFGTGAQSEAFFAANRFTEILFNLVAGGALASAFIPTFTTLLTQEDRRGAWKLASAVANLVVLVLTAVAALAFIFAPQVVRYILAPGFTDPAQQALTADLLRIMLPSAIIFGISGLVMGILNVHRHFLIPALTPALYQLGWIAGAVLLAPTMGIHGLAWGALLGACLHLLLQIPTLLRLPERRYTPTLGKGYPAVREVLLLMGPRLLGVAVVQLNFLLNTFLASAQPQGSLTAITLAFSLMIMPQAAIAQSIAIASLPTFSAQVARGKPDEMRASLAATLRGVLLLAVPASLGLMLLRGPLIGLLYQGGAFGDSSVELVSWALLWYAAGLVGHSVVEIVSRAFYALHDTRTPVAVGVAAMLLNLGFSLLFSALFTGWGLPPHGGLALANSLATFLEMVGLLYLMRRRLNGLGGGALGTWWRWPASPWAARPTACCCWRSATGKPEWRWACCGGSKKSLL
jgi:putative peptidoglycan lipid II flippase